MSHLKERKEKSCLNCNAVINGKYCSVCGQENLDPQESLWHLIVHFFNDITHFDGKFFSSVKYVITKPGFLTSQYATGRRMSYLNPVRFYVFTSFIFFLVIFSFLKKDDFIKLDERSPIEKNKIDSAKVNNVLTFAGADSLKKAEVYKKQSTPKSAFFRIADYKNRAEYDSLKKLGKTTNKWYKKMLINKQFELQEKYGDDREKTLDAWKHEIVGFLPQMLFLSLPFFALLLKLLYVRRNKFYYVAHVIFTIHFYIFVYITILVGSFSKTIGEFNYFGWVKVLGVIVSLSPVYYLYKAMRNFYEQSRWKTILKLLILLFFLIFLVGFFTILLMALSIYKM